MQLKVKGFCILCFCIIGCHSNYTLPESFFFGVTFFSIHLFFRALLFDSYIHDSGTVGDWSSIDYYVIKCFPVHRFRLSNGVITLSVNVHIRSDLL